jgi:hypothetical protein
MRQTIYLVPALVVMAGIGFGAPCTNGTLATYIGLGSGGCTIGTNTLYDFQTVSGTAGATEIATKNVSIAPLGGNFNPGFTASVNQTAGAGNELEAIFTYRIGGGPYVGDSISLGGSSQTGDGAVTDIQNFCAGGTFGPDGLTGCTGTAGNLLTLNGTQNQDSTALGPAGLVSVTDDFILDGGLTGSASGGKFTDRFSAVPEPASVLLAGLGLALGIGARLKARGRGGLNK